MAATRMCPHCRAFVEPAEKVCPYCEAVLNAPRRRVAPAVQGSGFGAHTHATTVILLSINVGLFIAMMVLSQKLGGDLLSVRGDVADVFGAKVRYAIVIEGHWWRLITAGFLHAGLMHIAMNTWVLYDLGAQVEHIFGTARFLAIYLISNVFGFWASLWWTSAPSMGASAALCGLIGAMMAYGKRSGQSFVFSQYLRWIVMIAVIGLIIPFIDNAAHFGGFAAGFAIGWLAASETVSAAVETLWRAVATACVVATAAAMLLAWSEITRALGGA